MGGYQGSLAEARQPFAVVRNPFGVDGRLRGGVGNCAFSARKFKGASSLGHLTADGGGVWKGGRFESAGYAGTKDSTDAHSASLPAQGDGILGNTKARLGERLAVGYQAKLK